MREPTSVPWWGRLSTLWLLLPLLCCAIYTLLLPISPNDFWYNARAGEYIAHHWQVPRVALGTTSVPAGTPYYYQSWISQWLLFEVLRGGGLASIALLRTLLLTGAFAVVLIAVCRRISRVADGRLGQTLCARIAAMSTLLGFALAASNMDIRPQTFSIPIFAAFVWALFEWPHVNCRKKIGTVVALDLLMLLWANTHGAFVVGIVLAGAICFGELLRIRHARHDFALAAGLFVSCIFVPMINPRGWEIYRYVFTLSQLAAGQKFIEEWQPPNFSQWYGVLFFAAILTTIVLLAINRHQAKKLKKSAAKHSPNTPFYCAEIAALALVSIMAARDTRSIIWFALLLPPIFAALITALFWGRKSGDSACKVDEIATPRAAQIANATIGLLLLSSLVFFLPWYKPMLPFPSEFVRQFSPNPKGHFPLGFQNDPSLLLENTTPVGAADWLQRNPPRGKLWNDFVYGSYLVWVSQSNLNLRADADPRVEMRSLKYWERYGRIAEGKQIDGQAASEWLRDQGFSDALLDKIAQTQLASALKRSGWEEKYSDRNSLVLTTD